MVRLNTTQLQKKANFIDDYIQSSNAADGSKLDSNANVSTKNLATLSAEIHKDINIQINRKLIFDRLKKRFSTDLANEYLRQLEDHEIYTHDETSLLPYCVSISMYPFILNGLLDFGGESRAPKHLSSFNGGFVNLIFAIASQFAGACLYKDQTITIRKDGKVYTDTIKNIINQYNLDKSFTNNQGEWLFTDVEGLEIWERGKFVSLNKFYKRLYKDKIYKITTSGGKEVKCSKDHKFMVKYKDRDFEVRAEELKLGDTLYRTDNNTPIKSGSEDYEKGQFLGIIAGDGHIHKDGVRIAINYKEKFIADFLETFLKKNYPKINCYLKEGNGCYDFQINSRSLYTEVKEYFDGERSIDKSLKDDMFNTSSLDFLTGFLDGILVTDGGFTNRVHSLGLINEKLVSQIKTIVEKLNINCSDIREIKKSGNLKNAKKFYNINIPQKVNKYLDLTKIRRSKNKLFDPEYISKDYYYGSNAFKNSPGKDTPNVCVSKSKKENYKDLLTDAVCSIEIMENDDDFVYEVETETHWYSTGDILTHNCATVEYLMYFDHYARKEYGNDYLETQKDIITQELQQVVYALNQPAAARGFQSVFWNISVFDKFYFDSMFANFVFPDGDTPNWDTTSNLQKYFMKWFNNERTKAVLTFPVVTAAVLHDGEKLKDPEYEDFLAQELGEGNSFFIFSDKNAYSLSSCCRLRNDVKDQINEFSYSLGAGGVMTGSQNVITINVNRLIQDKRDIVEEVQKVHKYQLAFNDLFKEYQEAGLMPVFDAGFISLEKQFLTVGVNGVVEAAEYLGFEISNNPEYTAWVSNLLKSISDENKKASKEYKVKFNTEFVPAENLGSKFSAWDSKEELIKVTIGGKSKFFNLNDNIQLEDGEIEAKNLTESMVIDKIWYETVNM